MTVLTDQEVLDAWGQSAEEVGDQLGRFADTARVLSSNQPRLIDSHPKEWVGVYGGRVEVTGMSLASVVKQIETRGLPMSETLVRYIDADQKTMIL